MAQYALDIGQAEFQRGVLELSHRVPVIVDFWAPWCEPCKILKPLLERLAVEYSGRFVLVKINSDDNPELSQQLGVRSIPTVLAFRNGEVIDQFTGVRPESELRTFIDALLPSPADPLRAAAAELLAAGDQQGALEKLQEASELDPNNEEVRLDAAEILLAQQKTVDAQNLLDLTYSAGNARVEALRIKLSLATQPSTADSEALRLELAATPDKHQLRLELARADAAAGYYREALEGLLEIVRRDRSFEDDAGRKTMLQIFDMLSADPAHQPLVREYRRYLATLLN